MKFKDIEEQSKIDDRSYAQYIFDALSGISPSRFMGAKRDIPYMTGLAPADLERAKLFEYGVGPGVQASFYRTLAPDSTITYQYGDADSYPGYEDGYGGMSMDQLMAQNLMDIDLNKLASYLADYRSELK